ncbi:group II truncated hemoglobin [Cellulomonas sp. S1-8]|uniref:group II truncated hemoglobin n=1 Tax=Cellulomonas sp. S1-8 TaxID=2904790 RepID=UPI002243E0B0|nr:group II truncated hemoglobin [Cellulomonas sp. S1-8]UZN03753.1 group II truncated hemoglobin [Cellulomonas sp. S1-8]
MTASDVPTRDALTLYEHVGGEAGVRRLVESWYPTVLADPLLQQLFGAGHDDHIPHLTAFLAEVFGGPRVYTERLGGFPALLEHHSGLGIDEEQRRRFVELFLAAADRVGWPDDERTRTALVEYLEFGTEVAAQNSHARSEHDLHPCQEVPVWEW